MAENLQRIEVAVTVITHERRLLVAGNRQWGAFTLPMTKLQRRQLGMIPGRVRIEPWADAAMRNVGECLGRTSARPPKLLLDVAELAQSDRSGEVHHYYFQVFWFEVDGPQLALGVAADWLTVEQLLEGERRPISPTARNLAARLQAEAVRRGLPFPPVGSGGPLRVSRAAMAITSRQQDGHKTWLAQWNESWQRYFLVGGHQKAGETASDCMLRELREELDLEPSQYTARQHERAPILNYVDWSTGAWQDTQYTIAPYAVELSPPAAERVDRDAANRWLAKDEILAERTEDDKPVSPTMKKILKLTSEL